MCGSKKELSLMFVDAELQLNLTFVRDNGHKSGKEGALTVDGDYRQDNKKYFFQSNGNHPLILLAIQHNVTVQRVQVLQRWATTESGSYPIFLPELSTLRHTVSIV